MFKAIRRTRRIVSVVSPSSMIFMKIMDDGVGGIVSKTGGDFIQADEPAAGFQDMMHRIRMRYTLYYLLPADKPGANRSVRVELRKEAASRFPKTQLRARRGYRVPHAAATP